jgi:hypothetical protein
MSPGDKYEVLQMMKAELAHALGWPLLPNLSWFQLWPGGWCFHGKGAIPQPTNDQRSMNFELNPAIKDPQAALDAAIEKVKAQAEKLTSNIRWFCPEHGWEEIKPVGVMSQGCPTCMNYHCEPVKQ